MESLNSPVPRRNLCSTSREAPLLALLTMAVVAGAAWPATTLASPHWEIRGAMSEACTCQVPCGCNFGQGPSPHHYCWSLASFDIKRGHYGGVSLGGQHLVRAHGGASTVWYVEESATTAQFDALQAIATRISGYARAGGPGLRFERARITQVAGDRGTSLQIGSKGGFDSDYIIGMDGKTPIVVENMQAWNVQHDIKAKAKRLYYKDQYGNQFDMAGTNSNQGKFDWTDKTPHYF